MDSVIHEERFAAAADFVRALHAGDSRWEPSPDAWVFRGHADARWRLVPSAFRAEAWAAFPDKNLIATTEGVRTATERLLLKQFGEGLDRMGLQVPGLSRLQLDSLKPESSFSPQWPRDTLELAALAQHHGLPTRLLDFSRHGHVGAYFAAQPTNEEAADLCVWCIRADFLELGDRVNHIWFTLAKASRASNPNLHAQAGVFVLWTGPDQIVGLDEIVEAVVGGSIPISSGPPWEARPVMRKLSLPRSQATELLRLLVYERITGATMFPGVEGVVRELKEQDLHQQYRRWDI